MNIYKDNQYAVAQMTLTDSVRDKMETYKALNTGVVSDNEASLKQ